MLRCSRCRTENADDARLCTECGSALSARDFGSDVTPSPEGIAASAEPSATTRPDAGRSQAAACPSCGRATSVTAQFCPSCGKTLIGGEYAGFWRRFGGFLIDAIILGVLGGIVGVIVSSNAGSIISFLIGLAYVVGLNANGGTLGKRVVGLRLEDAETGEDIGYPRAFVRYIVAIASALVLLLGYLWCIWDDKKQTWHDKAAGSVVVMS